MSIRLVIADDHSIVLHGLKRLFESHDDFEVLECCGDGRTALVAVREKPCDVLILDLRMPGETGLDVLRSLFTEKRSCRTVLLTAAISDNDVVEAVRLGAQGLVLKEASPDTLLDCVRRVHRGERCIDRETMTRALGHVRQREQAVQEASRILTPREIEIVGMVAQGLRNRAIAERLSISEGTVKIHLHNVYEKLGIDGRLELMLYAQGKGLV
jgi:two-component system, NarL family, nitrate/nitrite response regulator NarL